MTDTPQPTNNTIDAFSPDQIAIRIEIGGVAKANQPALKTATLGILAGAFISFGAMFYTLAITGADMGFGPSRLLGGVAFSLGLILVLIGGAELFTGNNLIVMAWAERKVTTAQLLRNWGLVYLANFAGAKVRFVTHRHIDDKAVAACVAAAKRTLDRTRRVA